MENTKREFGDQIEFSPTYTDTYIDVDALVIMTEWSVFRNPDFDHMLSQIRDRIIFDGRNLYDPTEMRDMGFSYYSVGRP